MKTRSFMDGPFLLTVGGSEGRFLEHEPPSLPYGPCNETSEVPQRWCPPHPGSPAGTDLRLRSAELPFSPFSPWQPYRHSIKALSTELPSTYSLHCGSPTGTALRRRRQSYPPPTLHTVAALQAVHVLEARVTELPSIPLSPCGPCKDSPEKICSNSSK